MALLGRREMSDLSPQSGPKRTLDWRHGGHPAQPLPPSVRLEYGAVQERGAAFQAGNVHLKVRLGRVIVSNRVPGNASTGLRSKLRRLAIF